MYSIDLKTLKKEIEEKRLTYKSYLRYYKFAFLLNDKEIYKLLVNIIPSDLDEFTEERFYELDTCLKMKLARKI